VAVLGKEYKNGQNKIREKLTYLSEARDATVSSPRLSPTAPTAAVAAITDWLLLLLLPSPFQSVEVTWDMSGLWCGCLVVIGPVTRLEGWLASEVCGGGRSVHAV
jgi:hypothetical protein